VGAAAPAPSTAGAAGGGVDDPGLEGVMVASGGDEADRADVAALEDVMEEGGEEGEEGGAPKWDAEYGHMLTSLCSEFALPDQSSLLDCSMQELREALATVGKANGYKEGWMDGAVTTCGRKKPIIIRLGLEVSYLVSGKAPKLPRKRTALAAGSSAPPAQCVTPAASQGEALPEMPSPRQINFLPPN
jgi:hypothetical protein